MKNKIGLIIKTVILIILTILDRAIVGLYVNTKSKDLICHTLYDDKNYHLIVAICILVILIFAFYFLISELLKKDKIITILTLIVFIACSTINVFNLKRQLSYRPIKCGECVNIPIKNCTCEEKSCLCKKDNSDEEITCPNPNN